MESLSSSLGDLTPRQREWGLSHIIKHYCLHWSKSRRNTCVECGHVWTADKPHVCPNCGSRLTVLENSRRRKFYECGYYGLVQRVKEFTVIRIFYVQDTKWLGSPERHTFFTEVLQHWVNDAGKDTIRARCIAMFPYYRTCPFSLYSDLSLKRNNTRYGYRYTYYHFIPDGYYPKMTCSRLLKRNGFRTSFHGLCPEDVFTGLLTDNRFETLWKIGRYTWANAYLHNDRQRIIKYWRSVLKCPARTKEEIILWLDYFDLLEYFGKPISIDSKYPYSIRVLHDRLVEKKRLIEERQLLEKKKLREREQLAILESKSKYFGITFGNDSIFVIVLRTLEDYKHEGDLQKHCVYTNSYYGKKDSLVLSARMRDAPDKPVETVEISLSDGKILQCFGKCNRFTEHHQEILDLVSANSMKFLKV